MTDKPIIFSGPMVRALLDGQKTQTRRILKPQPDTKNGGTIWSGTPFGPLSYNGTWPDGTRSIQSVPYAPGDRLYVREALALDGHPEPSNRYQADDAPLLWKTRDQAVWLSEYARDVAPSIHMPRWASRLTLTVTEVRVQRLQEISTLDCIAEGIAPDLADAMEASGRSDLAQRHAYHDTYVAGYRTLWNSLHGPDAWDANPWVVAVSFTVDRRNIDAIPRQD